LHKAGFEFASQKLFLAHNCIAKCKCAIAVLSGHLLHLWIVNCIHIFFTHII